MQENLAEFVDLMAEIVDLPLPPEYRDSVIANFDRICTIAKFVNEFPIPDDVEAAPVFEP